MSTSPAVAPDPKVARGDTAPTPSPLLTYIPSITVGACAMGLMMWALLNGPLWPDHKPLMNVFTALLCGTMGSLWGGVMIQMVWQPDPRLRVAIQAVGGAAIFIFLMLRPIYPAETHHRLSKADPSWPASLVSIVEPADGSTTTADIAIRGRTSYAGLHFYCLVKATSVGTAAIQDGELVRSESGELVGKARIGNSDVGAGQTFTITIVGSKKPLHSGPLLSTDGLMYSNTITVRRSATEHREDEKS